MSRPLLLMVAVACAACGLDRSGLGTVIGPVVDDGGGGAGGLSLDGGAGIDGAGGGDGSGGWDTGGLGDAGLEVPPEAPPISPVGCSDGTREGFLNQAGYPLIAACAGGWDVPGLLSPMANAPQCGRQSGNSSANPTGTGCSVADLCAVGWHVCLSAREVFQIAGDCKDAVGAVGVAGRAFYVTRQRALGVICPAANDVGTNRLHGCGNFGGNEDKSCTPFTLLLRDQDCQGAAPWSCPVTTTGPTVHAEYETVTKVGAAFGGALCCQD